MKNDSQSINDILASLFKCAMTKKIYLIVCLQRK